jgi:uncharacterized membrane protein
MTARAGLLAFDRLELDFMVLESLLPGALLLGAAGAAACIGYLGLLRRRPERQAVLLTALRIAAATIVCLLLLRPVIRGFHFAQDNAHVAILLDTSRSMGIRDEAKKSSRLEIAKNILFDPDQGLLQALGQDFTVDLFQFSEALEELPEDRASIPAPEGGTTDPGKALRDVLSRYTQDSLAALVVLSDGRETGQGSVRTILSECPPVHAIGIGIPEGAPLAVPDAGVTRITHDGKVLMGDRLVVSAEGRVTAREKDELLEVDFLVDGKHTMTDTVPLSPDRAGKEDTQRFECSFSWVARSPGPHEIGIRIQALSGEPCLENNLRTALVEVSSRRIEVLVYESRPRWEYKFLRKALSRDPNLNLTSLVRTGPGHYLQQGASPVDLSNGLPGSLETLGKFDCIMLGDVLPEDFAPAGLEALRRYVEEGVGGLVLAGSFRAFGPGGFQYSAIEPALPVTIPSSPETATGNFPLRVTRAGAAHPLTRDMGAWFDEGAASSRLESLCTTGPLKPGSQALAAANVGNDTWLPLLVVHRYGAGRVAALFSESTWKWAMGLPSRDEPDGPHARFWGRMARWASGRDTPNPPSPEDGEIRLSRFHLAQGEHATLKVMKPAEGLAGTMEDEESRTREVAFKPDGQVAMATIAPDSAGFHTIRVMDGSGAPVGEARVYVDRSFEEIRELTQDRNLLIHLGKATGGAYHTPADAGRIPSMIHQQTLSSAQRMEWRLEEHPLAYFLVVFLLGLEWLIRRRTGMV